MKKLLIAILLGALLLTSVALVANPFNGAKQKSHKTTPRGVITAAQYQKMIGVGVDVDWLTFAWVNREYFYWRSKGVNVPSYFKKEGFSNVRIRVGYDVVNNKTALTELGDVVNDTLSAGLIPIITYTAPGLRNHPTNRTEQEHFVEWWVTVARYFKGSSYLLSYDLLIESSGQIKNYPGVLNKVYAETISKIRAIDPYRLIFVTPAWVSKPFYLDKLNVTNDHYILAEWHIYAGGPRKCTYNVSYINAAVETAVNWSRKTGIPTWVGAWRPQWYPHKNKKGIVKGAPCPEDVVMNFSRVMVNTLNSAGIPYDINADTRFFDIDNLTWYKSQEKLLALILGKG